MTGGKHVVCLQQRGTETVLPSCDDITIKVQTVNSFVNLDIGSVADAQRTLSAPMILLTNRFQWKL